MTGRADSSAELTSPFAGVLKTINKANGELTKVGQTLCTIEVDGGEEPVEAEEQEAAAEPAETSPEPVQGEPAGIEAAAEIQHEAEDLLQPIDNSMSSSGAGQFSGEAGILPSPATYARAEEPAHTTPVHRRERERDPQRNKGLASPAVRTHAARMGLELAKIHGTGPGGRIMREDLVAAQAGASSSPASVVSTSKVEDVTRVQFGRSRKAMWKGMGKMGAVPHFG